VPISFAVDFNGSLSCGTTSTILRWNPVAGASFYSIRFDDTANPWSGDCGNLNPEIYVLIFPGLHTRLIIYKMTIRHTGGFMQ
jgi:hypothetical protein